MYMRPQTAMTAAVGAVLVAAAAAVEADPPAAAAVGVDLAAVVGVDQAEWTSLKDRNSNSNAKQFLNWMF